ncbi:yif1b-b, partial [Symbiodinium sp. KB8]
FLAHTAANLAKDQMGSMMVRWVPGLKALWSTSKFYFAVDSKYVARKLAILAMPWTRKDWRRGWDTVPVEGHPGATEARERPPVADANAPDLYIPAMAFVTFVLAIGLVKGVAMKFTPEVLSSVATTCLTVWIAETLLMYGAVYFTLSSTAVRGVGFVDLLALGGYKFVGLVVALLAGLAGGNIVFFAALAYVSASITFANWRWLSAALSELPIAMQGRTKAVVLAAAGVQVFSARENARASQHTRESRAKHDCVMASAAARGERAMWVTVQFALCAVRHPRTGRWLCVEEKKNRGTAADVPLVHIGAGHVGSRLAGWWIAGGGVDYGETFAEAAVREVKEETSIDVRLKGVLKVEHSAFGKSARMRVIFLGEPADPDQEPKSVPDAESQGAAWLSVEDMERLAAGRKLRGAEPLEWAKFVEAGGLAAPLSILGDEGSAARAVGEPAGVTVEVPAAS